MYGETNHWIKLSVMQSSTQRETRAGKILGSAVNPEKGFQLNMPFSYAEVLWQAFMIFWLFKKLLEGWAKHYIMEIAARTVIWESIFRQIPLQTGYRNMAEQNSLQRREERPQSRLKG